MTKRNKTKIPESAPFCTFDITFRDREHFYKIVRAMNEYAGKGRNNWTTRGKVLTHLKHGQEIVRTVEVYNTDFDKTNALYLALL